MMKRILSLITLLFIPIVLISIIYAGQYFFTTPYEQFLQTTLDSIQRNDLKTVLQNKYFTSEKYHWVQITTLLMSGFSVILLIYFVLKITRCYHAMESHWEYFAHWMKNQFNLFKQVTSLQKVVLLSLLALIIVRSIYYATHFYIQYDEAWNYNYFLQKNILFSVFAYNNYPLHNLLTFLFLKACPSSTFFLRLPIILFGLASCLSLFIISQKIFKETWLSILSVCLFASLPVSIYYMLYARGVMVNMFFLLWLYYFGWKLTRSSATYSLPLFVLLHVLGTMAILTHPIFIVMQWGTVLWLFLLKRRHLILQKINIVFVCSLLGSGFIFLLFYLGSGIQLSPAASTISIRYHLPYHSYAAFYGGMTWSFYVLLAVHMFLLFKKETQEYVYLILLNILLLISIPVLHLFFGNYPPERAVPFLFLPVVFGFKLLWKFLSAQKITWMLWRKSGALSTSHSVLPNPPKEGAAIPMANTLSGHMKLIAMMTILFSVYLNISTYKSKYMNWSKELDHQVFLLAEKLRETNIHTIYYTSKDFNYFVPGITYYSSLHAFPLSCYTNQKGSTRYHPAMKESAKAIACEADTSLHKPILFRLDNMVVYLN